MLKVAELRVEAEGGGWEAVRLVRAGSGWFVEEEVEEGDWGCRIPRSVTEQGAQELLDWFGGVADRVGACEVLAEGWIDGVYDELDGLLDGLDAESGREDPIAALVARYVWGGSGWAAHSNGSRTGLGRAPLSVGRRSVARGPQGRGANAR